MELTEAIEGTTRIFIPLQDPDSEFPPGTAQVFFNSRMQISRDATVLVMKELKPEQYLDAMGATGVRGIRVASECGIPVTINDRDINAVDLIRKNASLSPGAEIHVSHQDTNVLLSSQRFDAVDIDPFGTPAPFIDSAIRGTRRFLMVTATDTAPLCGAHKKAGLRRYFSSPLNNEYHAETALRTLLCFVVRETVKYDIGIIPLFCFSHEHFVRLHLQFRRGAKSADTTLASIGYILQCPRCPERVEQHGFLPAAQSCQSCGSLLEPVGPLWLGSLQSYTLLDSMQDHIDNVTLGTTRELRQLLALCRNELTTSSFYDYHQLAKREGRSPPPIEVVLHRIRDSGYPATRTHYLGTGIKTTAPVPVLIDAIRAR